MLSSPLLDSRRRQAFCVAAFLDELPLQARNLPVEQVVGLMDQADDGIGNHR
jgi:hypothetical protein